MTTFRFGAQMYTVRDHCQTPEDFRAAVQQVAAMGYQCMQLSGQCKMDAAYIRDCCDEAGIEIACTHIGFDAMLEDLDAVIRDHRVYGCRYPGIGGLPGRYYANGLESLRTFTREASDIAKRLDDAGMHFIYHNHAHEFQRIDGSLVMDVLMGECAPQVQFELDLFWVQRGGGNPIDWIHRNAGRGDVIHFKDMVGLPDSQNAITTVGKGNMNWPAILKACDETNVRFAMVEQDNAVDEDSMGCLDFAYRYLKGLGCRV
ncbi:MAG: sugar phosphate isomerase/epimerase [Clostridia bacterium]